MSATHEVDYRGKKIHITVAKHGPMYAGTILIAGFEPALRDTAADASSEESALHNAERRAIELIDMKLGPEA